MLDPLALVALDLDGSLESSQPLTLKKPFSNSHPMGTEPVSDPGFHPKLLAKLL